MSSFLINGHAGSNIDVGDRGFQYGDGVFETIAYCNHKLQLWDEHMQRLQQACKRLSLSCIEESVWLDDIKKLQPENNSVIKLIISRGVSGRGYAYTSGDSVTRVAAVYAWPNYTQQNAQGITAVFCQTPVSMNPILAGIKHLNRLDNVLARNECWHEDIAEGFMLDNQQHIIEGTMSNVFCVLDNELYTPLLDQCGVEGVMRQQVIKLAQQLNIPVNIIEISKQNFLQMDAVFLTNSIIGLWNVNKIIENDNVTEFLKCDLVGKLKDVLGTSQV